MKFSALLLAGTAALALTGIQAHAGDNDRDDADRDIRHVLLISIDGMHAIDYRNCAHGIAGVNDGKPYCPNLAELGESGINYVAASTSRPSDSFPGLTAIVSGGTPRVEGAYYDVAYDRSLDAPAKTTGNGVAGAPGLCTPGAAPTGTTTEYEEGIDIDQTKLNGGAPGAGLVDGGANSIDPLRLPRDPKAGCAPVYPYNFVRTNTIFGVVRKAGGYTSWFDKHPSYTSVAGPGGNGLSEFFAPEINSLVVPIPGYKTPAGVDCSTVPDPSQTGSWTDSFANIQCYDTIKADAILKQIEGKDHNGRPSRVPTLFGMNFQAVSVGQKLIEKGVGSGGYLDAAGTPSELLLGEIQYVDAEIGRMVDKLKDTGRYHSTLIVITAKHGQGPIDPHRFVPQLKQPNGSSPATVLDNAGLIPFSGAPSNPTGIGPTEDDVSLIWLKDSKQTDAAVALLEANSSAIGLGTIFYGPTVSLNYNKPGLPPDGDPRTPDIIVTPNPGVIYTGSSKKQEEHGGFSHDDTNVMLLLSNPSFKGRTVYSDVATTQVAPTILKSLGLNPRELQAVQLEGTGVLPDVSFDK